ncbi:hypothetical protein ABEB36_009358 [Hypothenemus hampei]|uniref:Uncharacterized protein n=1 Tax=Hypothenemus hampei TaxID=57062 RepID=A0ABD1EJ15_HYPHA
MVLTHFSNFCGLEPFTSTSTICERDLCHKQGLYNIFIWFKEWNDKEQRLTYPSEHLTTFVGMSVTALETFMEYSRYKGLSKQASAYICQNVPYEWLTCTTHKRDIKELIIIGVVRVSVPWWCKRINRKYYEQKKDIRNESCFTRTGILKLHNEHVYADENPHSTTVRHYYNESTLSENSTFLTAARFHRNQCRALTLANFEIDLLGFEDDLKSHVLSYLNLRKSRVHTSDRSNFLICYSLGHSEQEYIYLTVLRDRGVNWGAGWGKKLTRYDTTQHDTTRHDTTRPALFVNKLKRRFS